MEATVSRLGFMSVWLTRTSHRWSSNTGCQSGLHIDEPLYYEFTTRNVIELNGFGNLVVSRDFNQDGKLDLAIADDLGRVGVWLRDMMWWFKPGEMYVTGAGSYGVIAEDFNDDGFLDLAVANAGEQTVTVYYNAPTK